MNRFVLVALAALMIASSASAILIEHFDPGEESVEMSVGPGMDDKATVVFPRGVCVDWASLSITGSSHGISSADEVDIILITDVSGSMDGPMSAEDDTPMIAVLRDVARDFVNAFIIPGSDVHRVGLVSYSTTSALDLGLTADRDQVIDVIDAYTAGGWTCISCGVQTAIDELESNGREDAIKVIILMSDGMANYVIGGTRAESRPWDGPANPARIEAYERACSDIDSAVERGYVVHTIAFGREGDVDELLLEDIAECSARELGEGEAYVGREADELQEIYEALGTIGSDTLPIPRINVTRQGYLRDAYDFSMDEELGDTITWYRDSTGAGCDDASCEDIVDVLNERLVACNYEDESTHPECLIDFNVYSTQEGVVTLADLGIETKLAYTGPIAVPGGNPDWIGVEPFSCDGIYVCGDGNLVPDIECETGMIAQTVLTIQSAPSMRDTCDFYTGIYDVPPLAGHASHCSDPDYATRKEAANFASKFFVDQYLPLNENNLLGSVVYHSTAPFGQRGELSRDSTYLYGRIDYTIADSTSPICFSCAMARAANDIFEDYDDPSIKRTILVMSDGVANKCVQNDPLYGSNPDCNTVPGTTDEERAARQAIDLAEHYHDLYGITVYTVGYGSGADEDTLREMAHRTGGEYFSAQNIDDLIEAYREIAFASAAECTDTCRYIDYDLPVCGDMNIDLGEECDDGVSGNRPLDYVCDPGDEPSCSFCNVDCQEITIENPDADEPGGYCGDGDDSDPDTECDRGSENRHPDDGCPEGPGPCRICHEQTCQWYEIGGPDDNGDDNGENGHPSPEMECVDITVGESAVTVNLNEYVVSLGTFLLDLTWDFEYVRAKPLGSWTPEIVSNNVLVVDADSDFEEGRIILNVTDDDDQSALLCLDFTSQSMLYGSDDVGPTRLLIRQGRIVSGYIEQPLTGSIETWGPYRITAEVWQR